MARTILTDEMWGCLKEAISQHSVYLTEGLRNQIEAIIFRMKKGIPWRDLPKQFGKWNSIYRRFKAWSDRGIWESISELLLPIPDFSTGYVDSTYIRVHQHAFGCSRKIDSLIGRSSGGPTTKIHAVVDKNGKIIYKLLTKGNAHDCPVGEQIAEELEGVLGEFVADKAYDSDTLRDLIERNDAIAVIPRKSNSTKPKRGFHKTKYKKRHKIENFFAKIKNYRAVATRYDKLPSVFLSTVTITTIVLAIS